jgi:hypothetical protein
MKRYLIAFSLIALACSNSDDKNQQETTGGNGGGSGTAGTNGEQLTGGSGGSSGDGGIGQPAGSGGSAASDSAVQDSATDSAVGADGQGTDGGAGTGGSGGSGDSGVDSGTDSGVANPACAYECRTDGSGVTGWYSGNSLVCAADCTGCAASCSAVGTRSEGCYAACPTGSSSGGCHDSSSNLIEFKNCGQSYPDAYLAWDAPGGVAGTGPAVVVSGKGWADTWDSVAGFCLDSPETPPSNATGTYTLTKTQTDDLFSRLAAVNVSSLPHSSSLNYECYPVLYFRLCEGCATTTLEYHVPQQLEPEMDPVWLWFDQLLTASANTNPRNWCDWDL